MNEPKQMPIPQSRQMAPILHPAAQEAAAAYSEALTRAASMDAELRELKILYEAAKRHIGLLEKQLADSEYHRNTLERYAVEVTTHLDGISLAINAAKQRALAVAKEAPPPAPRDIPHAVVEDLERALAEDRINAGTDKNDGH